jgi:hypothetical protein
MKALRNRPLTRELLIVVAIKIMLIVTIKIVFFSDPIRPDSDAVARALLSSAPTHVEGKSHP